MERRIAVADELARKVNYVRDWLNKAEAAIQRGDTLEAIAKLSLAKADTTNLISTLIPQAKESRRPRAAMAPSFAWRRLAMLGAPVVLIGCFLLGFAVGGMPPAGVGTHVLNPSLSGDALRSVDRPSIHGDLIALVTDTAAPAQTLPDEASASSSGSAMKGVVQRTAKGSASSKASSPVEKEAAEASAGSDERPVVTSAEEALNLFDFGLDVIRAARQNMGR